MHRQLITLRARTTRAYVGGRGARAAGGLGRRLAAAVERAGALVDWWTRLRPIRTEAEIPLEFVLFTQEAFQWERIAGEAATMWRLGMSFRAIGAALGVDEKTVRKALGRRAT